ncbi:MAG: glycosyltransferase family 39 protein [Deltaproteobacteria bacterium]|nr:glycosyltransferase family 39 protein [Deltaproteobacteria bacterium]
MQKPVERTLLVLLAVLLLFLFGVALSLGIDMYDTYEIFLNAKTLAGEVNSWYFPTRAYVMPLVFSPVFALAKHVADDAPSFALTACHLVSMLLSTALAWAAYRIFRFHLGRLYSLLGAALLMFNPLIIHAAPISKEDIPGALLTTWTFYFYLRYWRSGRLKYGLLTALFVMLTMGTRYNVIPLLPIIMAAHELLKPRGKLRLADFARKAALLTVAPTLLWILIPSLLYFFIGRAEFLDAPGMFLHELYQASVGAVGSEMGYPEYPWENVVFLIRSCSIPISALTIWGMAGSWRRQTPGALFHGLWLGIFLAFHSFALGHKEARYLFCLFPPVYFFALLGMKNLMRPGARRSTQLAMLAAVFTWPLYNAGAECAKFFDPFYRNNFAREISRYAASIAGEHEIRWLGPFYAIHPKQYVFDVEDEVTYLYHVYIHTVNYYTGKPMYATTRKIELSALGSAEQGLFPQGQYGSLLSEGEAVILNPEINPYVTKSVPKVLKPLVVERSHVMNFTPGAGGVFQAAQPFDAQIAVKATIAGMEFKTSGLPKSVFQVFALLSDGKTATAGLVDSRKGEQTILIPKNILPSGTTATKVWLLSFDSVKLFSIPTE